MPAAPPGERRPRCPRCGKPVEWQGNPTRPFCSVSCKLIDLGGWLDETYRIPEERSGEPPDPDPPARART